MISPRRLLGFVSLTGPVYDELTLHALTFLAQKLDLLDTLYEFDLGMNVPLSTTLGGDRAEAARIMMTLAALDRVSVISEAIAQYGAKIEREEAIMRIQTLQRRLRSAHGLGTDLVELLRKIREGRARSEARDDPRTNEDRSGGGWR